MIWPWTRPRDPQPGRCVVIDAAAIVKETGTVINDLEGSVGHHQTVARVADALCDFLRSVGTSRDGDGDPAGKPETAEDWSR